jgi:hypothetical protein
MSCRATRLDAHGYLAVPPHEGLDAPRRLVQWAHGTQRAILLVGADAASAQESAGLVVKGRRVFVPEAERVAWGLVLGEPALWLKVQEGWELLPQSRFDAAMARGCADPFAGAPAPSAMRQSSP